MTYYIKINKIKFGQDTFISPDLSKYDRIYIQQVIGPEELSFLCIFEMIAPFPNLINDFPENTITFLTQQEAVDFANQLFPPRFEFNEMIKTSYFSWEIKQDGTLEQPSFNSPKLTSVEEQILNNRDEIFITAVNYIKSNPTVTDAEILQIIPDTGIVRVQLLLGSYIFNAYSKGIILHPSWDCLKELILNNTIEELKRLEV